MWARYVGGVPLLTPHFTLQELTVTQQTGADGRVLANQPGDTEVLYLRILAELLLEPIRVLWDCPLRVTSGFRSEAVERAVQHRPFPEALKPSQHRRGQAADIAPLSGLDLDEAYRRIWASALPYDQLILEEAPRPDGPPVRWIHVSVAPVFYPPRREALVSHDNGLSFVAYQPHPTQENLA